MTKASAADPGARSVVPHPSVCSYPQREGNLVTPLIDGIPAFRRIGEACEGAERSVWVTVAYYSPEFRFPDGDEPLFDLLDRLSRRGIDVRVLFWRATPESPGFETTFSGSATDRETLRRRQAKFSARWDLAPRGRCQHQKSWIVDAGCPSETSFVGGLNVADPLLGQPGHVRGGRHDLYVEVRGPSATDVHHNFVQRWNEASERDRSDGAWGTEGRSDLSFPTVVSAPRGDSTVQVQRMINPGLYGDGVPTPGGTPFDIAAGETSVLEQYELAIDAARSSIYIENQALPVVALSRKLQHALRRGVWVTLVVPAEPEQHVRVARRDPSRVEHFAAIEELGTFETFALVGLAAGGPLGRPEAIYVHSKIMLVDDLWTTIGSCNLHAFSLGGHSEINASIWDPALTRRLRSELLAEHLGQDVGHLDDRASMELMKRASLSNRKSLVDGSGGWRGLAVALDPSGYGTLPWHV